MGKEEVVDGVGQVTLPDIVRPNRDILDLNRLKNQKMGDSGNINTDVLTLDLLEKAIDRLLELLTQLPQVGDPEIIFVLISRLN